MAEPQDPSSIGPNTGPDTAAAQTRQFISFRVGDDEFAIDIMAVREIKGWTETTVLPNQQDYMLGVLNLRGTIVPIGSTTDWPVYADESIVGRRIAMGAGAHGYSLFVDADALIAAYGATVADISQPAAAR